MGWMDRDDPEPESRSLSARMWSTSDTRRGPNSLNTTNNLRLWTTAKPRSTLTPIEAMRERLRRLRSDDGRGDRNPRTARWTAPWKAAPGPGSVREARERQEQGRRSTQFKPVTSVTQTRTRVAARRGGFATSEAKRRAAARNAVKGGRYGFKGGRPRTLTSTGPAPTRSTTTSTRGRFTSETARQAGSRSTPAKRQAARVNARRPRKRTARPTVG